MQRESWPDAEGADAGTLLEAAIGPLRLTGVLRFGGQIMSNGEMMMTIICTLQERD